MLLISANNETSREVNSRLTRSKYEKVEPGTLAWQKQKIREEYVYPILEKENESMRAWRGSKRNISNKRISRNEF
jgi:hypothetical protein